MIYPAKVAMQQVKANKYDFRKRFGPVGQGWQRLLPRQRKLLNPITTGYLERSGHPHGWVFAARGLLAAPEVGSGWASLGGWPAEIRPR